MPGLSNLNRPVELACRAERTRRAEENEDGRFALGQFLKAPADFVPDTDVEGGGSLT